MRISRERISFALGLSSYAALHLALLPSRLVVFNDDFGYVESVMQTLETGRVVTDDFLAPYAAFSTVLSALAFAIGGHFYLATYGILFVFALAVYVLLFRLLREHLTPVSNATVTLVLVTLPIYLGKSLEFSATIAYVACFLAALLLYRRGSPWFWLSVFLAFSNRQPGIFLLGLPAWDVCEGWLRERKVDRARVVGIAATAAACAALAAVMNPTFARSVAGANLVRHFDAADFALNLELGVLLAVAFAATAQLLASPSPPWRRRRPVDWAVPLALSAVCLHVHWAREPARMVETWIAAPHWLERNLQGVLLSWSLVSAWLLDLRGHGSRRYAFVIAVLILYLALQETAWDYYWTEVFVLATLWALERRGGRRPLPIGSRAVLLAVLAANLHHAWAYKAFLDEVELKTVVYERLLREGRVSLSELSDAPFGYLGWKLFDVYAARHPDAPATGTERSTAAFLAGFEGFVEPRRVKLLVDRSPVEALRFRSAHVKTENLETLAEGRARIGFGDAWWRVARGLRVREPVLELGEVADVRFPLDDAEWRRDLERRRADPEVR